MQDPTSVMGRRLVAGIIDYFLLPFGLAAVTFALTIDVVEVPFCSSSTDSTCFEVGTNGSTDYYVLDGPIGLLYLVAFLAWLLNLVLLQTATGASLGKLALSLRTVDETGATAGFGKVLVRQLLWIVDGIGCVVPLVGPITALASKGHRRVGDLAAKTNVVGKESVGTPPMAGVVPGGYAVAATPPAPGGAWGAPPPAGAASPSAPGAAAGGQPGEPQWDEARGTYIQWDAAGQRWMAYDQASGTWNPIS